VEYRKIIIEVEERSMTKLLYQGHGSMRITTPEGKVIYVDPYAGGGYDMPADLILVTHQHGDHNQLDLIKTRNPGCEVFSNSEALAGGALQTLHWGDGTLTVEATEAGNKNHDPKECVGFILTFSDGVQLYVSGDTDKTAQMETLAERRLDYAFFCCDGRYNMDIAEASECAALVKARHSIPYHLTPNAPFDRALAEQFEAEGRMIVADGEEIALGVVKG
jgi:L-ascorbate metabolism protein UlaG (beta-lactamase superfamily)